MSWPQSQEYNEAIQSPASSFADPELRKGEAATNELGLPMPRSGNFADVYEVRCPNGVNWAVKCFTREVRGLRDRYQEISRYLQEVKLPFTVDFTYLEQGIRIAGRWYPILKMQWVEGFTFNDFIRQQLDKPAMLGGLLQIWSRMATRLRDSGIAHADLQHGNVLLVPGSTANSVAVKLIDYDGMYVPSLSGKKSGEVGHPSYQHPQRLREGIYSPEVDRFPVLLIATALRALRAKGKTLWEKYDNGDNLLFRQEDLEAPNKSPLFSDLLKLPDPADRALVQQLLDSTRKPLEQTPLLDELLLEPRPAPVRAPNTPTPAPASKTAVSVPLATPVVPNSVTAHPASTTDAHAQLFAFDDDNNKAEPAAPRSRRTTPQPQKISPVLLSLVGAAALATVVLLAGGIGVGIWAFSGPGRAKDKVDQPEDHQQANAETHHNDKDLKKDKADADKSSKKPDEKSPSPPLPPQIQIVDLGGGVKMEFVLIDPKSKPDGGKFKMGSPEDEKDHGLDEQQHDVELTKPYYLARYPVTQEQYRRVINQSPSSFTDDRLPVEQVSWNDAQDFCQKLMKKHGEQLPAALRQAKYRFALPTEAQWEYACRAGTTTAFFFGDDPKNLGDYAWLTDNSASRTHPVGQKKPNAWGLYDLHGNVWQWCEDYFGPYDDGLNQKDPLRRIKHASGERRVLRGGSWRDFLVRNCRSACRGYYAPDYRSSDVGFRVCIRLETDEPPTEIANIDPKLRRAYKNRNGSWKIDGDKLVQDSRMMNSQLVFGDFTWTDYDFTCDAMKLNGPEGFGLLYHVSGAKASSCYLGGNNNTKNSTRLITANESIFSNFERGDGKIEQDHWYKVRVSIRGKHCQCFLDDVMIFECDDTQNSQGAIGFWTWNTAVQFRKIRVTDPAGKVLFAGLPDLPANADQWLPATEPASDSELRCLKGHCAPVMGVLFSRDGRRVLSCNNREFGTIRLWDAEKGKELYHGEVQNNRGQKLGFLKLAAAPDGSAVLSATFAPSKVQLWQLVGDKFEGTPFPENVSNVMDLGFTPDGRKARALSSTGAVWEWDVADKKLTHQPAGDNKGSFISGALAPNGRFALLGRLKQPLVEIDLDTGKETDRWKEVVNDIPTCLAISPDSNRVLMGTDRGPIQLWDVASGKALHYMLTVHQGPVRAIAFSSDGRYALSGGEDQTVRLWDLEGRKELAIFKGHTGPVTTVAFSPDGRSAASGSDDYTVRLWRLGVTTASETPTPSNGEPDPIRENLDKAKAAYEAVWAKQKKNLLVSLDKAEDAARKAGNKDLVDQIKGDREAFEKSEMLPLNVSAKDSKDYQDHMYKAHADVDVAFQGAIAAYTKKKLDDKADAVKREKQRFEQAHPTDAFQVGTAWKGKAEQIWGPKGKPPLNKAGYDVTLTVLERDGKKFKANLVFGGDVREVHGTIEKGGIGWLAADVRVVRGDNGWDTLGRIVGPAIELGYKGPAKNEPTMEFQGIIKLNLEKK